MNNYIDQYDKFKKDGIRCPITFIDPIPEKEEYKNISENPYNITPNVYSISNFGNIICNDSGEMINQCNVKGYWRATLSGKAVSVHRLELMVFDYNDNYKNLQVNHKDGNPSNNIITNLEWTTPKENTDHAMLNNLHKMHGSDNPNNKLSEDQVREICELIQTGKYYDTEIAKMYNVSYVNISDIHKGKLWRNISRDYDLSTRKYLTLSPQDVEEICKLLESGKYFTTEIAEMYNTTHTNICDIKNGKTWKDISCKYNFENTKVRKFTKDQVREICELIQTGKYYDTEIAEMYGTTAYFLYSLRKGIVHKDISKDYDMTIRKPRSTNKKA